MALTSYPLPANEPERLNALRAYDIVDTPAETGFDDIARLAATLFRTPTALVSFVEERRQFFKARVGFDACETSREVSFCAHALVQDDVLVIPDAYQDERFKNNPLVLGSPFIRFYAGAPLITASGHKIGSVCVIDTVPRLDLTENERGLLRQLAKLVMNQLEQRRLVMLKRAALKLAGATPDAIVCSDESGTITFFNKAAQKTFGYSRAEAMGRQIETIVPSYLLNDDSHGKGPVEVRALRRDGTSVPVEVSKAVWSDEGLEQTGLIIRDVTERHRAIEQVSFLSHFDQLTGLPNRAKFIAAIAEELANRRCFAVLKLSLDKFRQVNTALGMAAGDLLLTQVAQRLSAYAGGEKSVARLGGDEFGILLAGCQDLEAATALSAGALQTFKEPFDIEGTRLRVTASAGMVFSAPGLERRDADGLLKNALLALQSAKAEGGGQLEVFRPALANRARERRVLEAELRAAFERKEFELHYQPQYRMADRRVAGAEALLRWRHPQKGLLSPAAFLSTLETSSDARAVGRWILDAAVAVSADLMRKGTPIRMGVNLFAAQLIGDDLAEVVTETLALHALPPALLELEITETTVLKVDDDVVGPLRLLRDLGVGIAFDDYGTGYASLSLLKKYPLTRLKIDREFVRDLGTDPDDAAIVMAVLAMSRSLGLHVTAEGIETEAQAELLQAWGCTEAQGFFFSKPLPEEQLRAVLRHHTAVAA